MSDRTNPSGCKIKINIAILITMIGTIRVVYTTVRALLEPDQANPSSKNVKTTDLYLPCPTGRFSVQYQGSAGILADAEA